MGNTKISKHERGIIARLLAQSYSIRAIANTLNRSPSSVSEEVRRNRYWNGDKYSYDALYAQEEYESRKSKAGKRVPLKSKWIYQYVMDGLRNNWSPEQIAGKLKIEHPLMRTRRVGVETIYRYIYDQTNKEEALWEYLPRGQKKRRKQKGRSVHRSHIPDRVSISDRPKAIDRRKEFGHYEGDTIEGRRSVGDGIHTEVERVSRKVYAKLVARITSEDTSKAQKEIFSPMPRATRKSTTLDNGKENHMHIKLTEELGMRTYFAHPYSSWERGTNENTNGLIRRYFPKGTNFRTITQDELNEVVEELNNRPRKVLGFKTPNEVFNSYTINCSDST